jgi:hypothetical protein
MVDSTENHPTLTAHLEFSGDGNAWDVRDAIFAAAREHGVRVTGRFFEVETGMDIDTGDSSSVPLKVIFPDDEDLCGSLAEGDIIILGDLVDWTVFQLCELPGFEQNQELYVTKLNEALKEIDYKLPDE